MVMELIHGASDLGMFIDKTIKQCLLEYDLSDTEAVLDNMVSGWPDKKDPGGPRRPTSQQCTCKANVLGAVSQAGPLRRMTSECSTVSQTSRATPDNNDVIDVDREQLDLNSAPSRDGDEGDKSLDHANTTRGGEGDGADKMNNFFSKIASCPELGKPGCSLNTRISREPTPERCNSSSPDPRPAKLKSRLQMRYLGDNHLLPHSPARDTVERTLQVKGYTANRLRDDSRGLTHDVLATVSPPRCSSAPDSGGELYRKMKTNEDHIDVLVEGILGPLKRKTGYGLKKFGRESTVGQRMKRYLQDDVMAGPDYKRSRISPLAVGGRDGGGESFDFIVPTHTSKVAALLESSNALDLTPQRHGSLYKPNKPFSHIQRDDAAAKKVQKEKQTAKSDITEQRASSPVDKDKEWLPSALATLLPDFERLMGVDPRNLMSQNLIRQLRQYREQQLLREQHRQRQIKGGANDFRDRIDDEESIDRKGKHSPVFSLESRGSKISSIIAEELQSDGGSSRSGYDHQETRAAIRQPSRQAGAAPEVLADGRRGHHIGDDMGDDRRCRCCQVPIPRDTGKGDYRATQHGSLHAASDPRPDRPTLLRHTVPDDHRAVERDRYPNPDIPRGRYEHDRSPDMDVQHFTGANKGQYLEAGHHLREGLPYMRSSLRRSYPYSPYHRQHFHRLSRHPASRGHRYEELHDNYHNHPYQHLYPLSSSPPQLSPTNLVDKFLLDEFEKKKLRQELAMRSSGRLDALEDDRFEYRRRSLAYQQEQLFDVPPHVHWESFGYRRGGPPLPPLPPLPHEAAQSHRDVPPTHYEAKRTSHHHSAHVRDNFPSLPPPLLPHLLKQPPLVSPFDHSPPPSHRIHTDKAPLTAPTQRVLLPSHHPRNQLNHLKESQNYVMENISVANDQPEDLSKKSKQVTESTKSFVPAHGNGATFSERLPSHDIITNNLKSYHEKRSQHGDNNNNNKPAKDRKGNEPSTFEEKHLSPDTTRSPVKALSPKSPVEGSPRTREADTTTNNTDTAEIVTPINLTKDSKTTYQTNRVQPCKENPPKTNLTSLIYPTPCDLTTQTGPLDLGMKTGAPRGYCSNPGSPYNARHLKPIGRLTP